MTKMNSKVEVRMINMTKNTFSLAKYWCGENIGIMNWDVIIHNPVYTFEAQLPANEGDASFFFAHEKDATWFTLKFT